MEMLDVENQGMQTSGMQAIRMLIHEAGHPERLAHQVICLYAAVKK